MILEKAQQLQVLLEKAEAQTSDPQELAQIGEDASLGLD
jgi:hypothetical protein